LEELQQFLMTRAHQDKSEFPLPSKQVLQSLSEQQAAMFMPDGQSRMVVEIREGRDRPPGGPRE
jgi:hypothetical protein